MNGLHLNTKQTPPAAWLWTERSAEEVSRIDLKLGSCSEPEAEDRAVSVSLELREAMLAAIPSLRAFAISLARNTDRADDLVQDTILRAWSNIGQFQAGTSIKAWMFTILRNAFLSQYRKAQREIADPDGSYAGRLRTPPDQNAKCDVRDMLDALQKLPPDQREALLLIVAEELSYEAAAQVCGVAVGTIKSRVNRARARLAQLLAVEHDEDLGTDRVTQAALPTAA
jgi:RNA polymerase sigma-70 factor (ECF subfamily)